MLHKLQTHTYMRKYEKVSQLLCKQLYKFLRIACTLQMEAQLKLERYNDITKKSESRSHNFKRRSS